MAARVAQNLGGLGSGGPMGGGSGSGGTCSEDIRVPDKMVGLIIGRGGEQITRLQAECGCKIQMAPDSGGLPGMFIYILYVTEYFCSNCNLLI